MRKEANYRDKDVIHQDKEDLLVHGSVFAKVTYNKRMAYQDTSNN